MLDCISVSKRETVPISLNDIVTVHRELYGIYIRPCVGSGFCCTQRPCMFGEFNEDKSACKYLLPPNEHGQRGCGRVDWIKENVCGWEVHPAFGQGCSSPIGNPARDKIIENLPVEIKSKIR